MSNIKVTIFCRNSPLLVQEYIALCVDAILAELGRVGIHAGLLLYLIQHEQQLTGTHLLPLIHWHFYNASSNFGSQAHLANGLQSALIIGRIQTYLGLWSHQHHLGRRRLRWQLSLTATSQAGSRQKAQEVWRDLKQTTHIFNTYLGKITETRKQQ